MFELLFRRGDSFVECGDAILERNRTFRHLLLLELESFLGYRVFCGHVLDLVVGRNKLARGVFQAVHNLILLHASIFEFVFHSGKGQLSSFGLCVGVHDASHGKLELISQCGNIGFRFPKAAANVAFRALADLGIPAKDFDVFL